jgi:hypothetical protein
MRNGIPIQIQLAQNGCRANGFKVPVSIILYYPLDDYQLLIPDTTNWHLTVGPKAPLPIAVATAIPNSIPSGILKLYNAFGNVFF